MDDWWETIFDLEKGRSTDFHVWLPDRYFNGRNFDMGRYKILDQTMSYIAIEVLIGCGVVWYPKLKPFVKKLYRRNVFQILTEDYRKTDCMFYWAPCNKHGDPKGGTAIAWRIAEAFSIPSFNIRIDSQYELAIKYLKGKQDERKT